MKEEPFILDFDNDEQTVLEPDFENLPYHFHSRLLYAFVPKEKIDAFLDQYPHRTLGSFSNRKCRCIGRFAREYNAFA